MRDNFSLIDLIRIAKNWWLTALVTALLFGAAGFVYYRFVEKTVYTTSGTLYVNSMGSSGDIGTIDISTINASQKLVATFIEILKGDTFLTGVAEKIGGNFTASQIRSIVRYSNAPDTEIITVRAVYGNRELATRVANAVLEGAQDEVTRVVKGGRVAVIDFAGEARASRTNLFTGVSMFLLLGLGAAFAVGFVIDFFDTRIKSEEDLRAIGYVTVLGVIPDIDALEIR